MPIEVVEKHGSGTYIQNAGEEPRIERTFIVTGTDSIEDAIANTPALNSLIRDSSPQFPGFIDLPENDGDLLRANMPLSRKEYRPLYDLEGGAWEVLLVYQKPTKSTGGRAHEIGKNEGRWTFSTDTVNVVRTAPGSTQKHYPDNAETQAVGEWIGHDGETLSGVDILAPKCEFVEYYELNGLSEANRATIMNLIAHTNNATFRGFGKGEVLFVGADALQREDSTWEIAYHFAVSRNRIGANAFNVTTLNPASKPAGTVVQSVEARGWEYVWYVTEDAKSGTTMTHAVHAVHVAEVYEDGTLTNLPGIDS